MPSPMTVVGSYNAPLTNPDYPRPVGAYAVYWLCAPGVVPVNAKPGDIIGDNSTVLNLQEPLPLGVPGQWTCYLNEEFTGTALNTTIWNPWWYNGAPVNNVNTLPTNAVVANGLLTMNLSDSSHGAAISSKPNNPSNKGFAIGAECLWEARIWYPGNGTDLYNWNAFWVLRDPDSTSDLNVEIDIAEVDGYASPPTASGAHMNFNYIHSLGHPTTTNTTQQQYFYGTPYLGDAWHTYGMHRTTTTLTLYLDGVAQTTIPTIAADPGEPQYCIINAGIGGTQQVPSSFQVDYVRAWAPTRTTPNLTYA